MSGKIDKSLIQSPITELCGSPADRSGPASSSSVYGLPGPSGVSAGLGTDPVLVYTDINPSTGADKPSDAKRFQGVNDTK